MGEKIKDLNPVIPFILLIFAAKNCFNSRIFGCLSGNFF